MLRLVVAICLAAAPSVAAPLYFFGDSLTDTGNVYRATNSFGGIVPVTPLSPPYFNGHFSDGPISG